MPAILRRQCLTPPWGITSGRRAGVSKRRNLGWAQENEGKLRASVKELAVFICFFHVFDVLRHVLACLEAVSCVWWPKLIACERFEERPRPASMDLASIVQKKRMEHQKERARQVLHARKPCNFDLFHLCVSQNSGKLSTLRSFESRCPFPSGHAGASAALLAQSRGV